MKRCGVGYSPLMQVGPISLPKAGNAIIGTQEGGRDASTRDRALSGRARSSLTEPGHQQARSPAPDRRRLHDAACQRTTDDIDICWLEEGEDFHKARLALRDAVQAIARRYTLPPHWFNFLTQMLIYDKIIMPRGKLWKRYGPLHVYAPPKEYILALKILAGRDQDLADCRILLPQTHIRTRQQAQRVLNRYILPEAQQDEAETIASSLDVLFGSEREREP